MIPTLIVSDSPSSSTGLGRITREIAVLADEHLKDVCRIATLGCGGPGSRKFKFQQYAIEGMGEDFVIPNLPEVWEDWAGNEPGVIIAIWDASRLGWFARPKVLCENDSLKAFLTSAKFQRWIYTPVDAEGPHGKLAYPLVQTLLGFNRILAYGAWAERVIRESLGDEAALERDLGSIPHGINSDTFQERRGNARCNFFSITDATTLRGIQGPAILSDEPLVGTVATNQSRKDWGLWAEACALFLSRHPKARFWIHIDQPERYWSIPALLVDFGLMDRTVISLGFLEDRRMAEAYSACDLTLGIGAGEGWGFPLAESLSCGTPVIHGEYAGGVEVVDNPDMLVEPIAYRYEGLYSCKRPVFAPQDWVDRMDAWLGKRSTLNPKFYWENNWPKWEQWFRRGLA